MRGSVGELWEGVLGRQEDNGVFPEGCRDVEGCDFGTRFMNCVSVGRKGEAAVWIDCIFALLIVDC